MLILGLPSAIGSWTLLVLAGLAIASPGAVDLVQRHRAARPSTLEQEPLEALTSRELERRWRRTSSRISRRDLAPGETLRLVDERVRLLDELERRDEDRFEVWLEVAPADVDGTGRPPTPR